MQELMRKLTLFAKERDWEQFHSPKNLSMALAVETAEIMEHFQWLTEEQSRNLDKKTLEKVKEESGCLTLIPASALSLRAIEITSRIFSISSNNFSSIIINRIFMFSFSHIKPKKYNIFFISFLKSIF